MKFKLKYSKIKHSWHIMKRVKDCNNKVAWIIIDSKPSQVEANKTKTRLIKEVKSA